MPEKFAMGSFRMKSLLQGLLFSAVSLALCTFHAAANSGQVEQAIERLEQDFLVDRSHCVPDPEGVTNLLTAIGNTSSEVERIRGMRWLSSAPFWAASIPKSDYWPLFLKFSNNDQPYSLRYYTGIAMVMEENELISSLFSEDLDRAEKLLELNENTNVVYADLAKLAVAQLILWQNGKINVAQPEEFSEVFQKVNSILANVFSGDDARAFLKPTSIVQDVALSRRILTVLSNGTNEETWAKLYTELGLNAKTAFDPALGIEQVNSRFFSPGRTVADSIFGRQARLCASTQQGLAQSNNRFFKLARDVRNRIVNPIYAIENVCRGIAENVSIEMLASEIANSTNQDYRVVIGHTRGETVRFSNNSASELENAARELMENHPSNGSAVETDSLNYCHLGVDPSFFIRDYTVHRFKSNGSDEGYVYIGQGLSRNEAVSLAKFVQSNRTFRGAYVFRPVDRR